MASTQYNIVRRMTFFIVFYYVMILTISKANALINTTSSSSSSNSFNTTRGQGSLSAIKSVCKDTPYPDLCIDTLKLSISINISPNILNFLLHALESAVLEATKLDTLLFDVYTGRSKLNIVEHNKGTLIDCKELQEITLNSLHRSVSRAQAGDSRKLPDAWAYLSAALTNKATCLEGLSTASGPAKSVLVNTVVDTYKQVSNSLAILAGHAVKKESRSGRKLIGSFPDWISEKARRILVDGDDEYDDLITVAADGTGNFTTVSDAISFAPNSSYDRIIIYVKEGIYPENVEIPSYKTNIVLLGDGADVTVITGDRSVADGWTTFRSATVAVSGEGFLARDIGFENTAGPGKHQAVALRVNADFTALYRCSISGYQDTLYVHSFRQFYRECDISGTIDYIFGNAAVVFQGCNIISRKPMPGQFTVVTAQSRETPDENTGISIQNCSIVASDDLLSSPGTVKSYLGRPWRNYSRAVVMESYVDGFIDPSGWTIWTGDQGLDTLYYGEYENYGPGSSTDNRVTWPGYHVMDYYEAYNFTVSDFITGQEWLGSTSFPYDDGI